VSLTAAMVAWAILKTRPNMPPAQLKNYARAVVKYADRTAYDPLLAVAIAHHESKWRPSAVSRDGEDIGLGQIRARFVGACRRDPSPVKAPGKACRAVRARLKVGAYNIKLIFAYLKAWRELCKTKTGSGKVLRVLAGYGGLSRPRLGRWCGARKRAGRWTDQKLPRAVTRIYNRWHDLRRAWDRCGRRCTAYKSARRKLTR
jgi:hypothetical protein